MQKAGSLEHYQMWHIRVQTTFTARYPTMLHSTLLKITTKYHQTPNIQVLWLSRTSRLLPGKPTSSWGHTLKLHLLSSLGTSPQERKGLLQTSHRTGSVAVAQPTVPCMCLCESQPTSRVAVLEPALPSCLHCLPEASAPALPSHSWQAEGK